MTKTGGIGWLDLTVPNADNLRDFYASVCDWSPDEVSMGDYADYTMAQADGTSVAGICHARGVNADLPNVWLPYFVVEDLEVAAAKISASGGHIIETRHHEGKAVFCVAKDPSGAPFAVTLPVPD